MKREIKIKPLDAVLCLLLFFVAAFMLYRINVVLNYKWAWERIPGYLFFVDDTGSLRPNILIKGLFNTIRLSFWGILLSSVIGIAAGLCATSRSLFLRLVSRFYVDTIRNLPPLVIIFIFYYFIGDQILPGPEIGRFVKGLPEGIQKLIEILVAKPSGVASFISAVLALSLFEGAYMAEIVRAGIEAVNRGQWEAADALGFSRWQSMRHVILPQGLIQILPPLAGMFISLIKDSSIVSVISVQELTFGGTELMSSTYLTFEIWITIALLYLMLTLPCSYVVTRFETYLTKKRGGKRSTPSR